MSTTTPDRPSGPPRARSLRALWVALRRLAGRIGAAAVAAHRERVPF